MTAGGGYLYRLDEDTSLITTTIKVGWAPEDMVFSDGAIWVSDSEGDGSRPNAQDQDRLEHIDTVTNRVVATVAVHNPGLLAAGLGQVWVESGGHELVRIDASSNRKVADLPIPLPDHLNGLAVVGEFLMESLVVPGDERSSLLIRRVGNGQVVRSISFDGYVSTVQATSAGPVVPVQRPDATWEIDRLNPGAWTADLLGSVTGAEGAFTLACDPSDSCWGATSDATLMRLDINPILRVSVPTYLPTDGGNPPIEVAALGRRAWVLTAGGVLAVVAK